MSSRFSIFASRVNAASCAQQAIKIIKIITKKQIKNTKLKSYYNKSEKIDKYFI
jgi:hypothetical protein